MNDLEINFEIIKFSAEIFRDGKLSATCISLHAMEFIKDIHAHTRCTLKIVKKNIISIYL